MQSIFPFPYASPKLKVFFIFLNQKAAQSTKQSVEEGTVPMMLVLQIYCKFTASQLKTQGQSRSKVNAQALLEIGVEQSLETLSEKKNYYFTSTD